MDLSLPSADSSQNEELEMKMQELYTANRNIERLTANVEHLEQENEYLKIALAEKTELLEEAKKNEGKSKNDEMYRQMISELRHDLDECQAAEKTLREENMRLEKQLQQVLESSKASNNSSFHADFDAEEILSLNAQVSRLEEEKTRLQAELLEMSMKRQSETEEKARVQQELCERDEELECMESQFSTQCSISERLREENQQLKARLESEMGQVDEGRKGNSLFSEVDDRRVAAESKVVQFQRQMLETEEKLTREQKENKRLKNQLAFLRQSSKKGYDDDAVKALQDEVVQSKKTVADLTEKLIKLESKAQKNPVIEYNRSTSGGTDEDKCYITFLEGMIRTKTKEVNEVRSQAQASHLQCVRTDFHLTQANNEALGLRREVAQVKQRNYHLLASLQDLRCKYGEASEAQSPDKRRQSNNRFIGSNSSSSTTTTTSSALSSLNNNTSTHSQRNERAHTQSATCPDSVTVQNSIKETGKSVAVKPTPDAGKENVRLRDLVDTAAVGDRNRSKKGVQMVQEVKVMTSDGDQSTEELREDGNTGGKLRRTKWAGGGGKFNSVTYVKVPEDKPSECNQQ